MGSREVYISAMCSSYFGSSSRQKSVIPGRDAVSFYGPIRTYAQKMAKELLLKLSTIDIATYQLTYLLSAHDLSQSKKRCLFDRAGENVYGKLGRHKHCILDPDVSAHSPHGISGVISAIGSRVTRYIGA